MGEAKCPHCGETETDLDEYWPHNHGADSWDSEGECGSCGKPIVVRCTVSVSYRIVKATDGE